MAVITKFGEPQELYVTREGTLAEDVVTGDYLIFSGSQLLRKTRQGDTVYSAYAGANLRGRICGLARAFGSWRIGSQPRSLCQPRTRPMSDPDTERGWQMGGDA